MEYYEKIRIFTKDIQLYSLLATPLATFRFYLAAVEKSRLIFSRLRDKLWQCPSWEQGYLGSTVELYTNIALSFSQNINTHVQKGNVYYKYTSSTYSATYWHTPPELKLACITNVALGTGKGVVKPN